MTADQNNRRSRVELVIAVAVVVISLASLFTAVYQSVVMQRTLEASVWPRAEWENANFDEERRANAITFAIANRGVGPARIARAELLLKGTRMPNARSLLLACCIDGATQEERESNIRTLTESGDLRLFTSTVDGAAFHPGQKRALLVFDRPVDGNPALPVWDRLNTARDALDLAVCYCSVFDDCWITRARAFTQSTEPIRGCRTEEAPGFSG